jgi:hypothetical protein
MFKLVSQIIIVSILLACTACASMLRVDGPYEGKVIDAVTKQPIEGAVVHGTWHKRYLGGGTEYYDSYEVLTDKNGEFKIPGQGFLIFSDVEGMMLTIFKAGYEEVSPAYWKGLQGGSYDVVTWQGNKGIFKLHSMTLEERRKRVLTFPTDVPGKKEKLFRMESNKENIEIGSDPNTLFPMEGED